MQAALAALPETHRVALSLRYFDALGYAENRRLAACAPRSNRPA